MTRVEPPLGFAEALLFSTVRIDADTRNGSKKTGTGFFHEFQVNGKLVPALVTNKHVVVETVTGRLCFTQKGSNDKPLVGTTFTVTVEDFESKWISHPEKDIDLSILPIAMIDRLAAEKDVSIFSVFTDKDSIISSENLQLIDAIDDVVMIGYPDGLWDEQNNLPIARRGITATHPLYDFNGRPEFLIDAACFSGSSGSPVFLFKPGSSLRLKHDARTKQGNILALMGILYAGPQHRIDGQIEFKNIPTQPLTFRANIPNNLRVVIKASKLLGFQPLIESKMQEASHSPGK